MSTPEEPIENVESPSEDAGTSESEPVSMESLAPTAEAEESSETTEEAKPESAEESTEPAPEKTEEPEATEPEAAEKDAEPEAAEEGTEESEPEIEEAEIVEGFERNLFLAKDWLKSNPLRAAFAAVAIIASGATGYVVLRNAGESTEPTTIAADDTTAATAPGATGSSGPTAAAAPDSTTLAALTDSLAALRDSIRMADSINADIAGRLLGANDSRNARARRDMAAAEELCRDVVQPMIDALPASITGITAEPKLAAIGSLAVCRLENSENPDPMKAVQTIFYEANGEVDQAKITSQLSAILTPAQLRVLEAVRGGQSAPVPEEFDLS